MSLYTRKTTTISSSLPAKDKAQALRAAADATNPARWLAAFAASPTTSRNNQLLAANLQAKVEADPAIRDAVYVALVLATANAHAEADRVFLEPVCQPSNYCRQLSKCLLWSGEMESFGAQSSCCYLTVWNNSPQEPLTPPILSSKPAIHPYK